MVGSTAPSGIFKLASQRWSDFGASHFRKREGRCLSRHRQTGETSDTSLPRSAQADKPWTDGKAGFRDFLAAPPGHIRL